MTARHESMIRLVNNQSDFIFLLLLALMWRVKILVNTSLSPYRLIHVQNKKAVEMRVCFFVNANELTLVRSTCRRRGLKDCKGKG